MEYTGYLDFWFTDRPLVQRVEAFVALGLTRLDVWCWRSLPLAQLAAECQRLGAVLNSTFDDDMGSLADPVDNAKTLRSWAESLEIAVKYGIEHLFIFSNQVEVTERGEWTRRLSGNYLEAEQYANLLRQTEQILKLVEQTPVEVWVEGLNEFHIKGGVLVHNHELAADWVRRMAHPQFRLAFDCYHQQRGSGNLMWGLEQYAGLYPTVHIGDVPTRQEPGTGEINYPNLRAKLRQLGFNGYIGLEFSPSTSEAEALARTREFFPLD
jgi:hydroxypyruvate isomerase